METYFDDPSQVIQVIEALADPTRRKMLLLIHRSAPKGLTASNLADMLRKKIPTILHHLKNLEELGLIEFTMEKMERGGREVKHWRICHQQLTLKIDMENVGFLPENYIIRLFEEHKGAGGIITLDLAEMFEPKEIIELIRPKIPDVTERHAEIIINHIKKKKDLEHYLQKWIYQEFSNSARRLQLDFREFGTYFALDEKLTRLLFDQLARSEDFIVYEYHINGEVFYRLALRPIS